MSTNTIGIIGGGFCGTVLTIQLARQTNIPLSIFLFNHNYPLANGIAYSTDNIIHLLNVPAGRMSLFNDEPDHFVGWIRSKESYKEYHTNELESQFMPRKIYGEYVKEIFQQTVSNLKPFVKLTIIHEEVMDVTIENYTAELVLKNKLRLNVSKVILATGNHPPADLKIFNNDFYKSKNYFGNPWSKSSVENIVLDENIFIIGTSLTMVDTVLSLHDSGFKGKIFALSTRGLLPLPYYEYHPYLEILNDIKPGLNINELLAIFKKHKKLIQYKRMHVDDLTTALRPHVQRIWRELSLADKKRFLTHLSHYWAISRHRLPKQIFSFIQKLIKENKLEILAGNLVDLKEKDEEVIVTYRDRKSEKEKEIKVQRVINCTGPQSNVQKMRQSLIKNLMKKKYIQPDALSLGMNALPEGNILYPDGKTSDILFTLGTHLRGVFWESTAVPELRVQAEKLAGSLILEFEKNNLFSAPV